MDLLALYHPRASAPLDALAKLCGFPGKLGMDGSKVWQAFQDGEIVSIRNYCETDVAQHVSDVPALSAHARSCDP